MRYSLFTACRLVVACALISLLSLGIAQTEEQANQDYGAVATSIVSFEGHYGFADLLGPGDDLRVRLSVTPFFNFGIGAATEALFDLGNSFYGGGGLSAGFGGVYGSSVAAIGTVGYEIPLDSLSLITEFSTGVGYSYGSTVGIGLYPPVRLILGAKFDF